MSEEVKYIWDSPEVNDLVLDACAALEYLADNLDNGFLATDVHDAIHELVDYLEDRELIIADILEKVADYLDIKLPAPEDDDWRIPLWVLDKLKDRGLTENRHENNIIRRGNDTRSERDKNEQSVGDAEQYYVQNTPD